MSYLNIVINYHTHLLCGINTVRYPGHCILIPKRSMNVDQISSNVIFDKLFS